MNNTRQKHGNLDGHAVAWIEQVLIMASDGLWDVCSEAGRPSSSVSSFLDSRLTWPVVAACRPSAVSEGKGGVLGYGCHALRSWGVGRPLEAVAAGSLHCRQRSEIWMQLKCPSRTDDSENFRYN